MRVNIKVIVNEDVNIVLIRSSRNSEDEETPL